MKRYFLFSFFFAISSLLKAQDTYPEIIGLNEQEAVNQNFVYNDKVHSVQLFPQFEQVDDALYPPILKLSDQRTPLILHFDELGEEASDFQAKIYHCNSDWTISDFAAIEYLAEYNEFYLTDYEFSISTKVLYTHFKFEIPKVKIAGNYIVKVFKKGRESKTVLVRRFLVFENKVTISAQKVPIAGGTYFMKNHQIDFNIKYDAFELYNPSETVKVALRQNYRWDNAITKLKPLFIRELDKRLDYNHFDLSNTFKAGNEFRHFDFSSFQRRTFNVMETLSEDFIYIVNLYPEKARKGRVYNIQDNTDMNGRFYINSDLGNPELFGDYARVNFTLKSLSAEKSDIYVIGGFNNWNLDSKYKMEYQTSKRAYKLDALLKQGNYDYLYVLSDGKVTDSSTLSGSHRQTQNEYDIIVYYRPFGAKGDMIVGYLRLKD